MVVADLRSRESRTMALCDVLHSAVVLLLPEIDGDLPAHET
jgi:hypothetical protein